MEFNEKQIQAIETIHGPVMVLSCAGSGKTSVITARANRMVQSGIPADKILVVTFSKAAALEMKDRFCKQYGNYGVKFSTIHSICYFILARAYHLETSSVLKSGEKNTFLFNEYKRLREKHGNQLDMIYQDYQQFSSEIQLQISEYLYLTAIGKAKKRIGLEATIIADTADAYAKYKKVIGKIDFDDMVILCYQYFKAQPNALKEWQEVYQYIMIDEFQDTNIMQAEIFFMLASEKNICVVGDDDQAIYSFRNADVGVFRRFQKEYPNAVQINLEINYRSKPQIIQMASKLISNNHNRLIKKFGSSRKGQSKIGMVSVDGAVEEAERLINLIEMYRTEGVQLSDIAILYRIKKTASVLSSRLLSEGIPFYTKEVPENLYDGMVYQDIRAYYRLSNGLQGKTDLQRIINRPKRFIKANAVLNCKCSYESIYFAATKGITDGEKKETLSRAIKKLLHDLENLRDKKPADFLNYLCSMGYAEYLEEFAKYLKKASNTFSDEWKELSLEAKKYSSMDDWNAAVHERQKKLIDDMEKNKKVGVHLSTFHSSKGLQWKKVIIINANEGVTPCLKGKEDSDSQIEEERRLFYVAMTRAEDDLRIFYHKEEGEIKRSRFLEEI